MANASRDVDIGEARARREGQIFAAPAATRLAVRQSFTVTICALLGQRYGSLASASAHLTDPRSARFPPGRHRCVDGHRKRFDDDMPVTDEQIRAKRARYRDRRGTTAMRRGLRGTLRIASTTHTGLAAGAARAELRSSSPNRVLAGTPQPLHSLPWARFSLSTCSSSWRSSSSSSGPAAYPRRSLSWARVYATSAPLPRERTWPLGQPRR